MLTVDWLFLDMNAYFASVEQQLRPSLRGRPVAVAPVKTNSTCCIAVSYEARPYSIRTGTNVGEARRRCRRLQVVEARPGMYVQVHHQIVAAVESVLPVEQVLSIDEMVCRLSPQHRLPESAVAVAGHVKQAIAEQVGSYLRCSVGLAPNRFLAKVASNMQKPNGLTVLTRADLPRKLYALSLDDLPGIGAGMLARLHQSGIRTVRQLCGLSRQQLGEIWHSIVGQQWWSWLRGEELPTVPTVRRTVGHSHVLPPPFRTDDGARAVLIRLLHKAAARLRQMDYWASQLCVQVVFVDGWPKWKHTVYLGRCQDTQTILKLLDAAWQTKPAGGKPLRVGVTLLGLTPGRSTSLPLFEEERRAVQVAHAMDAINAARGPHAVYFASMHTARDTAPMRIAFTHIPDDDN